MKKKSLLKLNSNSSVVISGAIIGILICFLCILLFSVILVNYDIPHSAVRYCWIISSVAGGLITGLFCGKKVKSKGILWGAASALSASLIIVLSLFAINGLGASIFTLIIIPVYAVFGCIGGIISSNLR